jgi:hypothetical protein
VRWLGTVAVAPEHGLDGLRSALGGGATPARRIPWISSMSRAQRLRTHVRPHASAACRPTSGRTIRHRHGAPESSAPVGSGSAGSPCGSGLGPERTAVQTVAGAHTVKQRVWTKCPSSSNQTLDAISTF